jgi:hypothetical protein
MVHDHERRLARAPTGRLDRESHGLDIGFGSAGTVRVQPPGVALQRLNRRNPALSAEERSLHHLVEELCRLERRTDPGQPNRHGPGDLGGPW